MAGIFEQTIESELGHDTAVTRLEFDFVDDNGRELRMQYVYRHGDRAVGFFEMWRTDYAAAHTHYRVMSSLLSDCEGCLRQMAALEDIEEPDTNKVWCVMHILRLTIGTECSEGLWRVLDEFKDLDLFEGTFTDCKGNKYRVDISSIEPYVNGKPPQKSYCPLFADDDDIPF
jgi:hypothetical protein